MDRRQFTIGATAAGAGIALFAALAAFGSLRHPQAATEHTGPVEFLAIGGGFFLLTVGILVLFAAYVEFPEPNA